MPIFHFCLLAPNSKGLGSRNDSPLARNDLPFVPKIQFDVYSVHQLSNPPLGIKIVCKQRKGLFLPDIIRPNL